MPSNTAPSTHRRSSRRAAWLATLAAVTLVVGAFPRGQVNDPAYVFKDHYEKREVLIPMRDGVKLFTVLYLPRDTSKRYPFLVTRDAYGVRPYGPEAYRPWGGAYTDFSKEGFIFVYQDVRGRWKSEGTFIHHEPYVPGGPGPNSTTARAACRSTPSTMR